MSEYDVEDMLCDVLERHAVSIRLNPISGNYVLELGGLDQETKEFSGADLFTVVTAAWKTLE